MLHSRPPVVHTLHGPWTDQTRVFYSVTALHVHLVAISEAQRADNPSVPYIGTVHNGIDLTAYPYGEHKDDFLIYIGRANSDKGPKEAITIARRAGLPLHMILKRSEPPEREYFEREIQPLLASDIEAVGRVRELEPSDCRRWVEDRFSGAAMVRGYERIYRDVAGAGLARASAS
jgi:glycosyltransferase involved in cell wall biosynthesis